MKYRKRFLLFLVILAPGVCAGSGIPTSEEPGLPLVSALSPSEVMTRVGAIPKPGKILYGTASWYSESDPFINVYTANGEVFDDSQRTCASWDFAFNTSLKVTNLRNGKSVTCRVNDRGPSKRLHRLIDLTKSTFAKIADVRSGLIEVSVSPFEKN